MPGKQCHIHNQGSENVESDQKGQKWHLAFAQIIAVLKGNRLLTIYNTERMAQTLVSFFALLHEHPLDLSMRGLRGTALLFCSRQLNLNSLYIKKNLNIFTFVIQCYLKTVPEKMSSDKELLNCSFLLLPFNNEN